MTYIPLFLYSFRWNMEVSYYEQKSFWLLCAYMIRSRRGIETLVHLINISYCAVKLPPIMLMYDKVTHKNLIDSSLLFRNIKENLLFL